MTFSFPIFWPGPVSQGHITARWISLKPTPAASGHCHSILWCNTYINCTLGFAWAPRHNNAINMYWHLYWPNRVFFGHSIDSDPTTCAWFPNNRICHDIIHELSHRCWTHLRCGLYRAAHQTKHHGIFTSWDTNSHGLAEKRSAKDMALCSLPQAQKLRSTNSEHKKQPLSRHTVRMTYQTHKPLSVISILPREFQSDPLDLKLSKQETFLTWPRLTWCNVDRYCPCTVEPLKSHIVK